MYRLRLLGGLKRLHPSAPTLQLGSSTWQSNPLSPVWRRFIAVFHPLKTFSSNTYPSQVLSRNVYRMDLTRGTRTLGYWDTGY